MSEREGYINPITRHAKPFLKPALSAALDGFGGYLRCETCRREEPLGNPGARVTRTGWPKCCGYTMRWWTQRQIDAGEVPA